MADYATVADFEKALKRAKDYLDDAVEDAVRKETPLLAKTISERISTTGKDGDGGSFSTPYSRSHAFKRKKKGKGSLGTQTSYKGFYFQGTMWDNFKMMAVSASPDKISTSLGFDGDNAYKSNQELNVIHSDKEGAKPIGRPTMDEGRDYTRKIGFAIGEYLKSVL